MTLTAIAVANFFVQKALESNDAEMTPMKVLKLTYIAHGWHLALYNEPLINEPAQAWQYGPVVPSVYHAFKNYRNNQITQVYPIGEYVQDDRQRRFLERIWEVYKGYSGWDLSAMTHQPDTPWSIVWSGTGVPYVEIPNALIGEHYKQLAATQRG